MKKRDTNEITYRNAALIQLISKPTDEDEKKVELEIVTYHIYWNSENEGRIEKHVPLKIGKGYENKIKYIYHDKKGVEYEIATLEFHEITEKANGERFNKLPITNNEIVSEEMVKEGQTQRRIIYKNGDIAEYGINKGQYFWRIYKALNTKTVLVRMPDSLNLKSLNIGYNFQDTLRRYCHPDCFAGLIGALAEIKRMDVISTGMCFKYGSCFPSKTHPNGDSIDTIYFKTQAEEQKKIDAFRKFYFNYIIAGVYEWYNLLKCDSHDVDHNDHLHCGNFSAKAIVIK